MPEYELFAKLKSACQKDWDAYTRHRFVLGLGAGTLPEASFRYYLQQDYLFLIHFARAYGLAAFKAEDLEDLRAAAGAVSQIVGGEMALHVSYCERWGISEAEMAATPEDPANMAYTRYVLERGLAGDSLDLAAALAPCIVGYAEIGAWLAANASSKGEGNPYWEWIETYAAQDYQDVAWAHAAQLDRLMARRGGPRRVEGLIRTFGDATRLEVGFWQMGIEAEG
jgi:thiaminase/transcriptional activator TenA